MKIKEFIILPQAGSVNLVLARDEGGDVSEYTTPDAECLHDLIDQIVFTRDRHPVSESANRASAGE